MQKQMTMWDRTSLGVKAFVVGFLSGAIMVVALAVSGCNTVGGACRDLSIGAKAAADAMQPAMHNQKGQNDENETLP